MNPFCHKTKSKITASILVLYLIAFLTLTLAYEIKEAHHDCQGVHCSVCHQIQDMERTRERFSCSFGSEIVPFGAFFLIFITSFGKTINNPIKTPVQLHVRLNR